MMYSAIIYLLGKVGELVGIPPNTLHTGGNRMLKIIQAAKAQIQAKKRVQGRSFYFPKALNLDGTILIHDNDMLLAAGLEFACVAIFTDGTHRFFVDDKFLLLSYPSQKAIIAHEEGHAMLKHKAPSNLVRLFYPLIGKVHEHELAADQYAAEKVGVDNVIRMLQELQVISPSKELVYRINAL